MGGYLSLKKFIEAAQTSFPSTYIVALDDQRVVQKSVLEETHPELSKKDFNELNRKTWQIFKQALESTIGAERVNRICERYSFKMERMEAMGKPLQTKHIEMFAYGSAEIRTSDLKKTSNIKNLGDIKLKELTPVQLDSYCKSLNPFPMLGETIAPTRIGGTPMELWAWFLYSPTMMDKEKQELLSDVENLSQDAYLERLSKAVVNREIAEGAIIPAPGHNGGRDYYKMVKEIAADGLVACAFKPISQYSALKPLLIFRPSQFAPSHRDAIPTYMNDLQQNIGEMGYNAAKEQLDALMNSKFGSSEDGITVIGYSLGGAHAQRFVKDHWRKVSRLVTYNDPSVDSETAEAFAKEINIQPKLKKPLCIEIYRTQGDLVHYTGGKHLGCGVAHSDVQVMVCEWSHPKGKLLPYMLRHSDRWFDTDAADPYDLDLDYFFGKDCDYQLDNEKRGEEVLYYERLRRVWGGGVVFSVVKGLYRILLAASRRFNVSFVRTFSSPVSQKPQEAVPQSQRLARRV